MDQAKRSYENKTRQEFWEKKVVEARSLLRKYELINQEEIDLAINAIAKIMLTCKKSSSLIETVNSIIRRFLVTYKSIPEWFCPLFTYHWNCKRFLRGKRKGLKPIEISI